jgi:hypothetical protein
MQAFAVGRSGDILVLDMGEPVRVAELAKTLVRLSGKSPQEFKFIGLRPGEKLFEELFYPDERVLPSACAKIACTESVRLAWPALKRGLDELYIATSLGGRALILAQLQQIVPQFAYEGSEQTGNMENLPFNPTGSPIPSDSRLVTPALADRSRSPHHTWQVNPQINPLFGPMGGGPGD